MTGYNRRAFLGSLAALPLVATPPRPRARVRPEGMGLRYVGGPWDTSRYRVYLDGVAVTDRCTAADDREGYIVVYAKLPTGGMYVKPGTQDLQTEVRHGAVHMEIA